MVIAQTRRKHTSVRVVRHIFAQRIAERLNHAALDLPGSRLGVDRGAAVDGHDEPLDRDGAALDIDLYFGELRAKGRR